MLAPAPVKPFPLLFESICYFPFLDFSHFLHEDYTFLKGKG